MFLFKINYLPVENNNFDSIIHMILAFWRM